MSNPVKLGGVTVDADDPCALYQALYVIRLKLISGEMTGEYSVQSPVTRETVTFAPGHLGALTAELRRLQDACEAGASGRRARRRMPLSY